MNALSKLKIEKNVPVPLKRQVEGSESFTSIAKRMKNGDSILCNKKQMEGIKTALYNIGSFAITRRQGKTQNRYRIWKTNKSQRKA